MHEAVSSFAFPAFVGHCPKRFLRLLESGSDLYILLGLLIVANLHLPLGGSGYSMIFIPDDFLSGQWWRLIIHPFVHLSWYHLFLDAGAFLILYKGLMEKRKAQKAVYVAACGLCALAAVLVTTPMIYTRGLCGLSGIAHGLMAVSALEIIEKDSRSRMGWFSLFIVVFKVMYESLAGEVLFPFLLFGLCGVPLEAAHAGGVLGGLLSFVLAGMWKSRTVSFIPETN